MAMLAQATDRISLPIFSVAFRPFFLLGGVWSALALGIWIFAFVSGRSLSGSLSAVDWHIHEMLFGFVMAAIAGFILTAIANWRLEERRVGQECVRKCRSWWSP